MNKIFISLAAAGALVMAASCSSNAVNPVDQAIAISEQAVKDIQAAKRDTETRLIDLVAEHQIDSIADMLEKMFEAANDRVYDVYEAYDEDEPGKASSVAASLAKVNKTGFEPLDQAYAISEKAVNEIVKSKTDKEAEQIYETADHQIDSIAKVVGGKLEAAYKQVYKAYTAFDEDKVAADPSKASAPSTSSPEIADEIISIFMTAAQNIRNAKTDYQKELIYYTAKLKVEELADNYDPAYEDYRRINAAEKVMSAAWWNFEEPDDIRENVEDICETSSPEKQLENMIDKYTAKVEKAKSADDLTKIYADFMEDAMALEKKYPDFNPENKEALEAKIEKFQYALVAKAEEFDYIRENVEDIYEAPEEIDDECVEDYDDW